MVAPLHSNAPVAGRGKALARLWSRAEDSARPEREPEIQRLDADALLS